MQDKLVEITEDQPVRSADLPGRPDHGRPAVDHPFTITETGIDVLQVDLDWPTPDDLDLEVYKKNADGSLTEVGSSGNFVGEKERVEIGAPEPGDYVLRVINFASTTPTYDLTATLFDSTVVSSEEVPGLIESLDADVREGRQGPPAGAGDHRPGRAVQDRPEHLHHQVEEPGLTIAG